MMDFENEKNITIFTHPLIQHKISILRDKKTGTNEFRKLVEEIAMLEGFEALSDLPTEDVEIETPIETCMTPMISVWLAICSYFSGRSPEWFLVYFHLYQLLKAVTLIR